LRSWYAEVTSGNTDARFWEKQWIIGLLHVLRGVENQYVLGVMNRVQLVFLHGCLQEFDTATAEKVYAAFKRVTDVIGGLIVEGYRLKYLEAVERTSGMSKALVDRMVSVEVSKMVEEARALLT
jgi:hypothetical protein